MKRLFSRARKSIGDCDWMKKFPYEFFMRSILSKNLSKYEINQPLVRFCKVFLTLTRRTDYRLLTSGKRSFLIGLCSIAENLLATLTDTKSKLSLITQGDCLCLQTKIFLDLQMKTVLILWSYISTWISPSLQRKIR